MVLETSHTSKPAKITLWLSAWSRVPLWKGQWYTLQIS